MRYGGSGLSGRGRLARSLVRSKRDYVLYVLRHRKGFTVALVLFLIAVVMFVASPIAGSPVLTVLGLISTLGSVAEFRRHWRELRSYTLEPAEVEYESLAPPPYTEVVALPRRTRENDYAVAARRQLLRASGLTSEGDAATVATWDGSNYELPSDMKSIAAGVLYGHYRRNDAPHFNGRVVRQVTDLDATGRVAISGADYFDLLTTNYLAGRTVCDASGNCVVDGPPWLSSVRPDGSRRMLSLRQSRLANVIGVSSLAFTADVPRRLVLVRQSPVSASSPGLWAPSASGSMDERDVASRRPGEEMSFSQLVVRAMERELVEESNIEPALILGTRILGYYRWLNKGGKPEYAGVTRLGVRADQLRLLPRVEERPWVKRVSILGELDMTALRRGETLQALPEDLHDMARHEHVHLRDSTSFPLYMCLRYLGSALRHDTELRRWLGA